MSRSAVLLVLFVVGSPAPAGASPPPAPVPRPAPPEPGENWRAGFGLPEEIDPQKVAFARPAVRETFLKLDAAARKVAGADWAKRAGDRYPYFTWNGGSDGFNQTYAGAWEKVASTDRAAAARPNHAIHLSTTLYTGKPPPAYGFEVRSNWSPKTGWGAAVEFSTSEMKSGLYESFRLTLRHDDLLPAPRDALSVHGLLLGPGQGWFSASRTDDFYVYRFKVSSRAGGVGGFDRKPIGREVARYWASADAFREAALEELDRLEANAKDGIASGKLAEITTKGGPTGADAPRPVPNRAAGGPGAAGAVVPEAIRKAVLKEALADIDGQKKLVREHYKDMHAATVAAFPGLGEILSPPEKK
ncbi:MAG: hypothetical protein J0I06_06405 [Planctomycetes bacterium]|nr:hypothetical protein [Planctomycetota bacterium]